MVAIFKMADMNLQCPISRRMIWIVKVNYCVYVFVFILCVPIVMLLSQNARFGPKWGLSIRPTASAASSMPFVVSNVIHALPFLNYLLSFFFFFSFRLYQQGVAISDSSLHFSQTLHIPSILPPACPPSPHLISPVLFCFIATVSPACSCIHIVCIPTCYTIVPYNSFVLFIFIPLISSANLHLSNSIYNLYLSFVITMSSANIMVQGGSCRKSLPL